MDPIPHGTHTEYYSIPSFLALGTLRFSVHNSVIEQYCQAIRFWNLI